MIWLPPSNRMTMPLQLSFFKWRAHKTPKTPKMPRFMAQRLAQKPKMYPRTNGFTITHLAPEVVQAMATLTTTHLVHGVDQAMVPHMSIITLLAQEEVRDMGQLWFTIMVGVDVWLSEVLANVGGSNTQSPYFRWREKGRDSDGRLGVSIYLILDRQGTLYLIQMHFYQDSRWPAIFTLLVCKKHHVTRLRKSLVLKTAPRSARRATETPLPWNSRRPSSIPLCPCGLCAVSSL